MSPTSLSPSQIGNGTVDKNELEQFQMRTEDIEQFDEELWNIVKPGMLGPLKHMICSI